MKRALRSACSCHRLNSRWLCLLNQTHKVPLFHSFTSISHGNRSGFVSAATTPVERSRQRGRKRSVHSDGTRVCNVFDTVEESCRIMGWTLRKKEGKKQLPSVGAPVVLGLSNKQTHKQKSLLKSSQTEEFFQQREFNMTRAAWQTECRRCDIVPSSVAQMSFTGFALA